LAILKIIIREFVAKQKVYFSRRLKALIDTGQETGANLRSPLNPPKGELESRSTIGIPFDKEKLSNNIEIQAQ
jgi:hypothetical protein